MTFTYDVENRLVAVSGARTAELIYDPLGRLWEINSSTNASKQRLLYDGDALVAEYEYLGNITRRYMHDNGADQPLVWYDGGSVSAASRRHLFTNWQGSITAITDSAGAAININAYDAYGIPDADNVGRFQYTGQMWIGELELYHYKARAYSPTLGRFMQTDPIGYEDQWNLYAYVENDPANLVDPSGLDAVDCDGGTPEGDIIYVCADRNRAGCDAACAEHHIEAADLKNRWRQIQEEERRRRAREASEPKCRRFSNSNLGQAAEALDNVSDATGAASLGAAALALAAAPTVAGGAGAGTASAALGVVSTTAKGGSAIASYYDGNADAAQTAAVETAFNVVGGPVIGRILKAGDGPVESFVSDVATEGYTAMGSGMNCP